ncbi:MAG: hypothetical protein KA184_10510 [Candidatus Hydrogenedentes bacterium]|nr:hypothetical protein [Candidatus Hydrogenedentota bacterium]
MNPGLRIALTIAGVLILVFCALTLLAVLAKQHRAEESANGAPQTAADAAVPQPGSPPQSIPPPAPAFQPVPQSPQPPPPAPPPRRAPQQPQGWNAQNLVGTAWAVGTQYGNFIVHLQPGGQAIASTPMGTVVGNWRASGNNLTVSAMGQSYTCRIQGWQIIAGDGFPITKVN